MREMMALNPGEHEIATARPSLRGVGRDALIYGVIYVVLMLVMGLTGWQPTPPAAMVVQFVIFTLAIFAGLALSCLRDRWRLTDQRLIDDRRGRAIDLSAAEPVRIDRLFGGIVVAQPGLKLRLRCIHGAPDVARQIETARQARQQVTP
ncbi:hypothetical protein [Paracoccus sp. (in: a-proteobacteria)]|uniref:hypothetical protein n=1 Tax=Paracoccus sp. TaxID=267 RepID=UPI0026E03A0F|nr:hypothetical protein [Paracoccus sp. (in: a-proteobacteria)]MDO5648478.1 hypothetical protein [Paracoccus sp. (in: a-proteobacteria)]